MAHQSRAGPAGVMPLLFVFYLMFITDGCLATFQGIVQSPTSAVVYADTEAVFTCELTPAAIGGWRVNGINSRELSEEIVSGDTSNGLLTLTIPARAQYNNTVVQCVAKEFDGDGIERSDNVTLRIQGLLASVGEVKVDASSTVYSISLTWSPPFSLDVMGVEPDILYTVLITNVTDEDRPTAVSCTDCINLTQPQYTFTPDNPSPCHNYSFTVIPQNGAGEGNSSEPVHGVILTKPLGVADSTVNTTRSGDGGSGSVIDITLPEFQDCVESYIYLLHFIPARLSENERCQQFTCGPLKEQNLKLSCSASAEELPLNCMYNLQIESMNNAGSTNSTGNLIISTYDVQNGKSQPETGAANVSGELATNTDAMGCFIIFNSTSDSFERYQVALKSNDSCTTTVSDLRNSDYSVLVYDLEGNGLPGSTPAVMDEVNVTESTCCESPSEQFISEVLINVTIISTESILKVTCEFRANVAKEAMCVVIWHKRDEEKLQTITLKTSQSTHNISVNKTGEYSVAVFGKQKVIEKMPVLTRSVFMKTSDTTTDTPSYADSEPDSTSTIVPLVISITLVITSFFLVSVGVIVLLVLCRKKLKKKVHSEELTREVKTDGKIAIAADVGTVETISYSTVVASSAGRKPQTVNSTVPYETVDLKATKRQTHPHGLLYAGLDSLAAQKQSFSPKKRPSQYATLLPQENSLTSSKCPEKECLKKPEIPPKKKSFVPPTVETVMEMLWPVSGKWKEIAEGLGMDEDLVDEIFTNNERDEDCLQDCVERWMDWGPSWEKLGSALRTVGEEDLAEKAMKKVPPEAKSQSDDFVVMSAEKESGEDGCSEMTLPDGSTKMTTCGNEDGTRGTKRYVYNYKETAASLSQTELLVKVAPHLTEQQDTDANENVAHSPVDRTCPNKFEDVNPLLSPLVSDDVSVQCTEDNDSIVMTTCEGVWQVIYCGQTTTYFAKPLHTHQTSTTSFNETAAETVNLDVQQQSVQGSEGPVFVCPQAVTPTTSAQPDMVCDRNLPSDGLCSVTSSNRVETTYSGTSQPFIAKEQPPAPVMEGPLPPVNLFILPQPILTEDLEYEPCQANQPKKFSSAMITGHYPGRISKGMVLGVVSAYCDVIKKKLATVLASVVRGNSEEKPATDDAGTDPPFKCVIYNELCNEETEDITAPKGTHGAKDLKTIHRDMPFVKRQWSDPPDNLQRKLQKWTHNGTDLGFYGPNIIFL